MKHGRRHDSLKEKVYRERSAQGAPGYKTPYTSIDVRMPEKPPAPPPEDVVPITLKIGRKVKKRLAHAGVNVDSIDDAASEPGTDEE